MKVSVGVNVKVQIPMIHLLEDDEMMNNVCCDDDG